MQQILEFIPVVLFFFAYFSKKTLEFGEHTFQLGDIYSATIVLIAACVVQIIISFLIYRKIEKRNWAMFGIVVLFGGLTLFLRNELFIQWKPTITNWGFALVFIFGPFFTNGEPIIKKALGGQIEMPDIAWQKLTRFLIGCSIFLGALNLFVVYNYSEPTWVKFKLYSAIASSIITTAIILYIVAPYLDMDKLKEKQQDKQKDILNNEENS